jgi:hypothetical protein
MAIRRRARQGRPWNDRALQTTIGSQCSSLAAKPSASVLVGGGRSFERHQLLAVVIQCRFSVANAVFAHTSLTRDTRKLHSKG